MESYTKFLLPLKIANKPNGRGLPYAEKTSGTPLNLVLLSKTSLNRYGSWVINYVLYRDSQGQLVAMRDRCIHRGASLAGGWIEGNCIRCP